MTRNISLFFCIIFLLSSCNENEVEISLGNNFFYIPPKEIIFDVTTFYGNGIYKKENCDVIPIIFPNIIDYKFDSNFILVKQNFDFEQTSRLVENMLFMSNVYFKYDQKYLKLNKENLEKLDTLQKNSSYSKKFTENLLKTSTSIKIMEENENIYFIITKRNSKIQGPLTLYEFNKEVNKLKIMIKF